MRRTRQQIERESSKILESFDNIRNLSIRGEATDTELQNELAGIILSRVGEDAFDGVQKKTLWQIATEDDIRELKERYVTPKEFVSSELESEAVISLGIFNHIIKKDDSHELRLSESTYSEHSDKIALNLLSSRIGKLSQTLGFGINRKNGRVEFEVEFGVQRPGGTQARHISAYMMVLEVFKSRLTGMEVEAAIEVIPDIVGEYIKDSPGMRQFLEYARQQKDILVFQGVLSKEDRERVFRIEHATLDYLESYTRSLKERLEEVAQKGSKDFELIDFLRESLRAHQDILAQENERREIVSPMDSRNKYKEADLWKYQECFSSTLKAAVVTMNKMEMVSFKGEESSSARGQQGVAIKDAAARLRDRRHWERDSIDMEQHIKDIAALLDYPKSEVEVLSEEMVDVGLVLRVFNRHMKLAYDAFGGLRDLNQSEIFHVMRGAFLTFKKKQGWAEVNLKYPDPGFHKNIDTERLRYVLLEKFSASSSASLAAAIKELEAQIKSDIEDQVEEESKIQDPKDQHSSVPNMGHRLV